MQHLQVAMDRTLLSEVQSLESVEDVLKEQPRDVTPDGNPEASIGDVNHRLGQYNEESLTERISETD